MKTFARIFGASAFACWTFLFVRAAAGHMQIDTIAYCIAVGTLVLQSLFIIIRGY